MQGDGHRLKIWLRRLFFSAAVSVGAAGAHCCASALSVNPPLTAPPPVIDGRLDDACWAQAAVITNFHLLDGAALALPHPHRAYIARDDAWLYLAFDVAHPHAQWMAPQHLRRDDPVQRENCVKAAFDPGTDGRLWYWFRVSAHNVRGDRLQSVNGSRDDWNIPWRSAARIGTHGWSAELAWPWRLLAEGGDLSKARLNLVLHVFDPIIDDSQVKVGETRHVYGWAPTGPAWWQEPAAFGRIEGLAGAAFTAPFLPQVERVAMTGYARQGAGFVYGVRADVRAYGPAAGLAHLALIDRPQGAPERVIHTNIPLSGGATNVLELRMPVERLESREAQLVLYGAETGEVWQAEAVGAEEDWPVFAAFPDRNYYTTEPAARICYTVNLAAGDLAGIGLAVKDGGGRVLASAPRLLPRGSCPVEIDAWPAGAHTVRVECARADGGPPLAVQEAVVLKRPSQPGREWKIDQECGGLLNNGRPFFPLGVYFGWKHIPDQEAAMREIAAAGCNTIISWMAGRHLGAADVQTNLDMAQRHGLLLVSYIDQLFESAELNYRGRLTGDASLTRPERERRYDEFIRTNLPHILPKAAIIRQHPAALAYYLFDEPCFTKTLDMNPSGRKTYAALAGADGYHPAILLYNEKFQEGDENAAWCDIMAADIYVAPGAKSKGIYSSPNRVARWTEVLRRRSLRLRKANIVVLNGEVAGAVHKRVALPREHACQTYLALIHGARGLFYFCYPFKHQWSFDSLAQAAAEVRALTPSLTAPDVPQTIRYELPPGHPPSEFPLVQARLFARPPDGYVLLAANSVDLPVDADFQLSVLGAAGSVSRLFATNVLAVAGGVFSDRLEGHGVRAYAIAGQPAAADARGGAVEIRVALTPYPDQEKIFEEYDSSGRPGKTNRFLNPGLEEAALPGWPDYIRGWSRGPRIGQPGCPWELDENNPCEGRVSLRMDAPGASGAYCFFGPAGATNRPYVLSFYARGSRPGQTMEVAGLWPGKFKLTPAWERYWVTGMLPAAWPGRRNVLTFKINPNLEGSVWLDAIQFEEGSAPGVFTRD